WLGERPEKPQLLLYGLAVDALPAALSFGQVRRDDCAYVGVGVTESIPGLKTQMDSIVRGGPQFDSWEALNASWRQALERLAQAFVDGHAPVDPLPGSCTYCGLQGLCRIGSPADSDSEQPGEEGA
ncbi:MAG: PD-(D/E)XK nuclease family protein, partial [Halioglobus sp.]